MDVGEIFIGLAAVSAGSLLFGIVRAFGKKWRAAAVCAAVAVIFAGLAIGLHYSHASAIRRALKQADERARQEGERPGRGARDPELPCD
jgi:hypothetical protein